jgi:hypothetical protein
MPDDPDARHGDEWLIDALRERRPGAVGYVYNVHGPALIEYAKVLLGDHDLAVTTVRATLVACRADSDALPDPDRFRDWLHGRVRDECLLSLRPSMADEPHPGLQAELQAEPEPEPEPEPRPEPELVAGPAAAVGAGDGESGGPTRLSSLARVVRGQRGTAVAAAIGATGVVALAAGLVVFWPGEEQGPPVGAAAAPTSTRPAAQPPPPTPASPSPSASPSEKPEKKPEKKPKDKPEPRPSAMARGRLVIDDSDCGRMGAGALGRCSIQLTASGGRVRWAVTSVSGVGVSASGSGTLSRGESTSVAVVVRPSVRCYATGRGSAAVGFSPSGSATVLYTCWLP